MQVRSLTNHQKEKIEQLQKEKTALIQDCSKPITIFLLASLYYSLLLVLDKIYSFHEQQANLAYEEERENYNEEIKNQYSEHHLISDKYEETKSTIQHNSRLLESLKRQLKAIEEFAVETISDPEYDEYIVASGRAKMNDAIASTEAEIAYELSLLNERGALLREIEDNLQMNKRKFETYHLWYNKALAEIKNYYQIPYFLFSCFPFIKTHIYRASSQFYQQRFFSDAQPNQFKSELQLVKFTETLEKDVQNLKKISQRNKIAARLLTLFIFPIAIYQLLTSNEYHSFFDFVKLFPMILIGYEILEIACKDFRKDFDFSEQTKQRNEIIKAKQVLQTIIKQTLSTNTNLHLTIQEDNIYGVGDQLHGQGFSAKCISLIFLGKGNLLKRSMERIINIFKSNGISSLDSHSNYISFSHQDLLALTPDKISHLSQQLDLIAMDNLNSYRILKQLDVLQCFINNELKLNDYVVTPKPEMNDQGITSVRIYLEKIIDNKPFNKKLLKLFPNAETIVNDESRIELVITTPTDPEMFKQFLSQLKQHHNEQEFNSTYSDATHLQYRNKTSRREQKNIEKQQQKEKDRQKEREAKSKKGNASKSHEAKQRGEYIIGRGIPAGLFRLVNNLKPRDFPENHALYEQVSSKLAEAHMAGARKGANGFLFTGTSRKSCDNGKTIETSAKYKFKGDAGNVSIYCRCNGTTYYAEGVVLKHMKQRNGQI